jgi:hypothetical protein
MKLADVSKYEPGLDGNWDEWIVCVERYLRVEEKWQHVGEVAAQGAADAAAEAAAFATFKNLVIVSAPSLFADVQDYGNARDAWHGLLEQHVLEMRAAQSTNFTFQMYNLAVVNQAFTHNYMYTP